MSGCKLVLNTERVSDISPSQVTYLKYYKFSTKLGFSQVRLKISMTHQCSLLVKSSPKITRKRHATYIGWEGSTFENVFLYPKNTPTHTLPHIALQLRQDRDSRQVQHTGLYRGLSQPRHGFSFKFSLHLVYRAFIIAPMSIYIQHCPQLEYNYKSNRSYRHISNPYFLYMSYAYAQVTMHVLYWN